MSLMNVVIATPQQELKIIHKYFNIKDFVSTHCGVDGITYYITIKHKLCDCIDFQMYSNRPCFFQLSKGGTRYDIHYPEGELKELLHKYGKAIIDEWKEGSEL